MILQSLCDYYERRRNDAKNPIASDGFQFEEIPFVLLLSPDGELKEVEDTREKNGNRNVARRFLVPAAKKRSGKNASDQVNTLWDSAGYILGLPAEEKTADSALRQRESFFAHTKEMYIKTNDPQIGAVISFLEASNPAVSPELVARFPLLNDAASAGAKLTFRIVGSTGLVCQQPVVKQLLSEWEQELADSKGRCLITGRIEPIARLHPLIKSVRGGQSAGVNIVSFNSPAYSSYGWERGDNARIGTHAAYAYTTALNDLLSRESRRVKTLGEHLTVVFWGEDIPSLEEAFGDLFDSSEFVPEGESDQIRALYTTPFSGHWTPDRSDSRFYVLGLSPNVSRLSIRFWYSETAAGIGKKIGDYLADLRLSHHSMESGILPFSILLRAVCLKGKIEQLPPRVASELLRSALNGSQFPKTLISRCLERIRAEQGEVTFPRVALLKAFLSRTTLGKTANFREKLMTLDETNNSGSYLSGRVFAVLERIQEAANSKAKIREKYFSSASANPRWVIPRLMKLKNHHIGKLNAGLQIYFEKLLTSIINNLDRFPASLSLEDQALFTLGYYHQRHAFFERKEQETTTAEQEE